MTALPLAGRRVLEGKRILVMRAAHQAGKLSEGLRALGAVPVEVPVLEIQPPADPAPLDRALRILAAAHTDPCKADPSPSFRRLLPKGRETKPPTLPLRCSLDTIG